MTANHFPETDWHLIKRGAEAVEEIVQIYSPALRAHLKSERGVNGDNLEDLLSGFVLSELIQRDLIGRADPSRGRFRNLVKTALNRFVNGQYRHANAKKRQPSGTIFQLKDEGPADKPCADIFDVEWARIVLERVLIRLKTDCHESDQGIIWKIFVRRLLNPILSGDPTASYQQLRDEYNLRSPAQAANFLITAKRKYKVHLRAVIAEYASNEAEIDDEIRDLIKIFSGF